MELWNERQSVEQTLNDQQSAQLSYTHASLLLISSAHYMHDESSDVKRGQNLEAKTEAEAKILASRT